MSAIIENKDIKIMIKIQDILEKYRDDFTEEEKKDTEEFNLAVERFAKSKKNHANKQNDYNKAHKEYHRITNNITYALKTGNQEKVDFWRNKLKEYKEAKNEGRSLHKHAR